MSDENEIVKLRERMATQEALMKETLKDLSAVFHTYRGLAKRLNALTVELAKDRAFNKGVVAALGIIWTIMTVGLALYLGGGS
jgi:hypothetical protein